MSISNDDAVEIFTRLAALPTVGIDGLARVEVFRIISDQTEFGIDFGEYLVGN